MLASAARTAEVMPVIRRVLDVNGHRYPKARWSVSVPRDNTYVTVHLFLDVENSWRIDDLAAPIIRDAGPDVPPIVLLVQPSIVADLPDVFTAPVVSSSCPPE